jgi:hypothetical protein
MDRGQGRGIGQRRHGYYHAGVAHVTPRARLPDPVLLPDPSSTPSTPPTMTDDPTRGSEPPRIMSSRRRRRDSGGPGRGSLLAILAVIGIVVAGAAVWWQTSRGSEDAAGAGRVDGPTDETVLVGDTTGLPGAVVVSGEPFPGLPTLDGSDAWIRDRAGDLSPNPRWRDWLGSDGLVRRLVLAVVRVAAGESPAEPLPFLEPADTFMVVMENGRAFMDPASWRRYDGMVAAVTSLDARATARFYRGVAPLTEAEWLPLGFVERDFDDAVREAISIVLAAEVPDGQIELVQDGAVWAYADPNLEALSPATKHLLRIGPDNLLRLQDWVRTFAAASGLVR